MQVKPKIESTILERERHYYSRDRGGSAQAIKDSQTTWKWIDVFGTDTISVPTTLKSISDVIVSKQQRRLTLSANFFHYGTLHLYSGTTLYISNTNYYLGYDQTTFNSLNQAGMLGDCYLDIQDGSTIVIDNSTLYLRYSSKFNSCLLSNIIFKNGGTIIIEGEPDTIQVNGNYEIGSISGKLSDSDNFKFNYTQHFYRQNTDLSTYSLAESYSGQEAISKSSLVINNKLYNYFEEKLNLNTVVRYSLAQAYPKVLSYYFDRSLLELNFTTTLNKDSELDVVTISPSSIFVHYELPIPKTYVSNTSGSFSRPKTLSVNTINYSYNQINEYPQYFIPSGNNSIGSDSVVINYDYLYLVKFLFDSSDYKIENLWRDSILGVPTPPITISDQTRIFLGWYETSPFNYYNFSNKMSKNLILISHDVPRFYTISIVKELYKNSLLETSVNDSTKAEYLTPTTFALSFQKNVLGTVTSTLPSSFISISQTFNLVSNIVSYQNTTSFNRNYNPINTLTGNGFNTPYSVLVKYELMKFRIIFSKVFSLVKFSEVSDQMKYYGDSQTLTLDSKPKGYSFNGEWLNRKSITSNYNNKLNNFSNDTLVNWSTTGTIVSDPITNEKSLRVVAPSCHFSTSTFSVQPTELLEFSFGLTCPNYSSASGLFLGLTYGETYLIYTYNFVTRKWDSSGSGINCYFISNYLATTKKKFKTYILGNSVDISTVPPPDYEDESIPVKCLKLSPDKTSTALRTGYNAVTSGTIWLLSSPNIYTVQSSTALSPFLPIVGIDNDYDIIPNLQTKTFNISYILNGGTTTFSWRKYATDLLGSNLSNNPVGKLYEGSSVSKTTTSPSLIPTDYTWRKIGNPIKILNSTSPVATSGQFGYLQNQVYEYTSSLWNFIDYKLPENPDLNFTFADVSLPEIPDDPAGTLVLLPSPKINFTDYGSYGGTLGIGGKTVHIRARAGRGSIKGVGYPRFYIWRSDWSGGTMSWAWNFQEPTFQEFVFNVPNDGWEWKWNWYHYPSTSSGNSTISSFYLGNGEYLAQEDLVLNNSGMNFSLPKLPDDPVGNTFFRNNNFTSDDSSSFIYLTNCSYVLSSGKLVFTVNTNGAMWRLTKDPRNQEVIYVLTSSVDQTISIETDMHFYVSKSIKANEKTIISASCGNFSYVAYFLDMNFSATSLVTIEAIYIGTGKYLSGTRSLGTNYGCRPTTDGIHCFNNGFIKVPFVENLTAYTFSFWQDVNAGKMALGSDNAKFYKYGEVSWKDPIDEWYHGISFTGITRYMFTITWDGISQKIYINSVLKATRSHVGICSYSGNLLFGKWQQASTYNSYSYTGFFGDFIFYKKAIELSDIQTLYKIKHLPEVYTQHNYVSEVVGSNPTYFSVDNQAKFVPPTKAGYTFDVWKDQNSVVRTNTSSVFSDLVMNAFWNYITYTIAYSLNGGTNNVSSITSFNVDTNFTFLSPTKAGFTFDVWKDQNSVVRTSTSGLLVNLVMNAFWNYITYTIAYSLNGGTNNVSNIASFNVDTNFTFLSPTKSGFTFSSWKDQNSVVRTNTSGLLVNLVMNAFWNYITYTIAYSLNGGTNNVSNIASFNVDTNFTFLSPTKSGFTFVKWTDPVGVQLTSTTGIFNSLSLTANWIYITYTITYSLNGGTNNVSNIASFNVDTNFTFLSPTKAGFTFDVWKDQNSVVRTSTSGLLVNLVLTAFWKTV